MPVKGNRPKWKNSYYVRIYRLSSTGLKDAQIAENLGVKKSTFRIWKHSDPSVRDALKEGRTLSSGKVANTLNDFVYQRLPKELKPLWDSICEADEEPNGEKRLELLTRNCGRRAKQHLWLHALVSKHFNKNEACRVTGIAKSVVDGWAMADPDFQKLIGTMVDMKKDFVEGALMGLIAQGDTTATIFAAKSLLKKEGYDPKVVMEVSGTVKHAHLSLETLLDGVSLTARKEMLAAYRGESKPKQIAEHVPDAELVDDEE